MSKGKSFTIILKFIKNSRFPVSKKDITNELEDNDIYVNKRSVDRYLLELEQKFLIQKNDNKTFSINELVDRDEYELFLNFLYVSEISTLAMDNVSSRISIKKHIIPEYHQNFKGVEFLPDIFKAITGNKQLSFTYAKQFSEVRKRNVIPGLVKQYQNRWYLVAADLDADNTVKTYGLDRISKLSIGDKTSLKIHTLDADIFKNIVGIDKRPRIKGRNELTQVKISATEVQANIFESMPLHHSQKISRTKENPTLLSYNVIVNYEFIQHLFMYMPYIKVLEPQWLRQHIKEEANKISEMHQ